MYVDCSVLSGINKVDKLKTMPQGSTREALRLPGLKMGLLAWVPFLLLVHPGFVALSKTCTLDSASIAFPARCGS